MATGLASKAAYCVVSGGVGRHYPKTKATVVSETPEMARLAQNTKLQSQVNGIVTLPCGD